MTQTYLFKPQLVQAVRLNVLREHKTELPEGVRGVPSGGADNWAYSGCEFYIDSVVGLQRVYDGDWVITYSDGSRLCVRDKVFAASFHPIEPTDESPTDGSIGMLAVNEHGRLGIVTRVIESGPSNLLYLGVTLTGDRIGKAWSTRLPKFIFRISELDFSSMILGTVGT